jgi:hypothetical protein
MPASALSPVAIPAHMESIAPWVDLLQPAAAARSPEEPTDGRREGSEALSLPTMPDHIASAAWFGDVPGTTPFVRNGTRSTSANSRASSDAVRGASPQRFRLALMPARWISATWPARDACGAARASDMVIDVFLKCEDGSAPEFAAGARDEANGADARCFPAAAAIAATRGAKRLTASGSPAASCAYRSKPPSQIATTLTPPPAPCRRSSAARRADSR